MTHGVLGLTAAAVGLTAFCVCPLKARADTAPSASSPSLSEPAPTPGWAEAGPTSTGNGAIATPHRTHTAVRRSAFRRERGSPRPAGNPLAEAATGVVRGVADVGSVAAYPFYCFPHYGSCPVRTP